MLYDVAHTIQYDYSAPVGLGAHVIRLIPRSDGAQRLVDLRWEIRPKPAGTTRNLDAQGNDVLRAWFAGETSRLSIRFRSHVETLRENPFDCPKPAGAAPLDYGGDGALLRSYRDGPALDHPGLSEFLRGIRETAGGQAGELPLALCRGIFDGFKTEAREEGAPRTPEETWEAKAGACRDLAVLYTALARELGFAARFVSGYHDHGAGRRRELHAWVEVYTEEGGWRGYDPSTGLAAGLHHLAVASGARPGDAAPVSGTFSAKTPAAAKLKYAVALSRLN